MGMGSLRVATMMGAREPTSIDRVWKEAKRVTWNLRSKRRIAKAL